jgi:hypothetical protein
VGGCGERASFDSREYRRTVVRGNVSLTLEYLPTDALLVSEYRTNAASTDELARQRKAFANFFHFRLLIEPAAQDPRVINTMTFAMDDRVELSTDRIAGVPLASYQMVRTFGLSKRHTLLLAFPRNMNGVDLGDGNHSRLDIRVKELGLGVGDVTFRYEWPLADARLELASAHTGR